MAELSVEQVQNSFLSFLFHEELYYHATYHSYKVHSGY